MDIDDYFVPLKNHRLWWEKTFLSKIQPNRRINIYYSPNASGLHYFFIAQLMFLSKLSTLGNVHYYIVHNDQIFNSSKNKLTTNPSNRCCLNETISMLNYFGISSNNVHCYLFSECVNKLFSISPQAPFVFSKSLRLISPKMLILPKVHREYEYLGSKNTYPLSYYLPKVMDLFISQDFHNFFPEDIEGKIDVFVSSWFGMQFISKLYSLFLEKGLATDLKPILVSTKRFPFFGHNKSYYPRHIVPSIDMSVEDIYEAILIYNVKEGHMEQLLCDLLIPNLDGQFYISDSQGIIIKSNNITDFKKLSFEKKALALAYSFFEFFKEVNLVIKEAPKNNYLSINTKKNLDDLSVFFRSSLAFAVLRECNKKTISEIAKKLNKHQPNISKIVSNLKKIGLIESDNKGRFSIQVNTIKLDLLRILEE